MELYAYTITPKNGNKYDDRTNGLILVAGIETEFHKSQFDFTTMKLERCSKGKSNGKHHAHGFAWVHEEDINELKKDARKIFGGCRPLELIKVYAPDGWHSYSNKDQCLFSKLTHFKN